MKRLVMLESIYNALDTGICRFRSIPSTQSGAFRPLIPIDSVHPFRSIPSGLV